MKVTVASFPILCAIASASFLPAAFAAGASAPLGQPGQGQQSGKGQQKSLADEQILQRIHHANQGEITQARLAQSNTKDEAVLEFARMMIDAHSKADAKVASLAEKQLVRLADTLAPRDATETKELAAEKKTLEGLKVHRDAAFDRDYIAAQIDAHQRVLTKLDTFERSTRDEDVLALINQLRPDVQMHLDHAREIQQGLSR